MALLELREALIGAGVFEELAGAINEQLALPEDLLVRFDECGTANAFYSPVERSVTLCYELVVEIAEDFGRLVREEAERSAAIMQVVLFVFLHELGHAFIDLLDLPVTGKEEDAADQIATLFFIEGGPEGRTAALNSAVWFLLLARRERSRPLRYWGEHSLSAQRFYSILCWVYGAAPDAHDDLIRDGWLPMERAVRCPEEYRRINSSWKRLFAPYLKKGSTLLAQA